MTGARLHVRVDANGSIGLGHFMRCLALAQAWCDAGGTAEFIGTIAAAAATRLAEERIGYVALDAAHPDPVDLSSTLAAIPAGEPTVLDGYGFDSEYQSALAARTRLLVIDDLGRLPSYHGRLLLNQNPGAPETCYARAPHRRLLGPGYALLERRFGAPRAQPAGLPEHARRWLVTTGGADPGNAATAIVAALLAEPAAGDVELRVLVGPLNAHRTSLEALARADPRLELRVAPADVARELAWAELAVSAAGTTALELACLGVPAVLTAIAANQEPAGHHLESAGAAVYAGRFDGEAAARIAARCAELAASRGLRRRLAARGPRIVDGRGATRVCRALAEAASATEGHQQSEEQRRA